MTVFISYARANQATAEQLRGDVERCHHEVWVDRELTGGQSWWRAILQHIRDCDIFVVALSPQWVQSKACVLELRYAIALGRPVLPVMVAKIDPRLAPPTIADAQIVDYVQRSPEATFALRDALDSLPTAPPLPSPPPPEPPAPISYRHNIILMLNAPALDAGKQHWLWQQLQVALDEAEDDERAELLKLVRRLRRRRDLVRRLQPSIDAVLGPATASGEQTWPTTNVPPWTAPTQTQPVPAQVPPPPPRSRPRSAWAAVATAAALLVASVGIMTAIANNAGQNAASSPTIVVTTTPSAPPDTSTSDDDSGGDSGDDSDGDSNGNSDDGSGDGSGGDSGGICTMPDLDGMTLAEARTRFENDCGQQIHFESSEGFVSNQDDVDEVIDQNPEAGTLLTADAQVTVTIGKFEEPSSDPSVPESG